MFFVVYSWLAMRIQSAFSVGLLLLIAVVFQVERSAWRSNFGQGSGALLVEAVEIVKQEPLGSLHRPPVPAEVESEDTTDRESAGSEKPSARRRRSYREDTDRRARKARQDEKDAEEVADSTRKRSQRKAKASRSVDVDDAGGRPPRPTDVGSVADDASKRAEQAAKDIDDRVRNTIGDIRSRYGGGGASTGGDDGGSAPDDGHRGPRGPVGPRGHVGAGSNWVPGGALPEDMKDVQLGNGRTLYDIMHDVNERLKHVMAHADRVTKSIHEHRDSMHRREWSPSVSPPPAEAPEPAVPADGAVEASPPPEVISEPQVSDPATEAPEPLVLE